MGGIKMTINVFVKNINELILVLYYPFRFVMGCTKPPSPTPPRPKTASNAREIKHFLL